MNIPGSRSCACAASELGDGVGATGCKVKVIAVEAFTAFSCALSAGGEVWCWGGNGAGQIGDGTVFTRPIATKVPGLSGVTMLGRGLAYHVCAVTQVGEVWCWGKNTNGVLGDGTQIDRAMPVRVPGLPKIVAVDYSSTATCGLTATGAVYCWGQSDAVRGTDKFVPTPVQIANVTDAVQVAVGVKHGCVLRRDGGVRCWGNNSDGLLGLGSLEPNKVYEAAVDATIATWPIQQIVAKDDFRTCAVLKDQTARCWGGYQTGVMDLGVRDVAWMSMSFTTTCALTLPDEVVRCWSKFNHLEQSAPRFVKGARSVTAGSDHFCSLVEGGSVVCWGNNLVGALGQGTTEGMNDTPTQVLGFY